MSNKRDEILNRKPKKSSLGDIKSHPLMKKLLHKINDTQLEILYYKYVEGLGIKGISTVLNLPESTVEDELEVIDAYIKGCGKNG